MSTKVLALYLPQFHPVPENDRWWGAGFTEWRPCAAARPLFRGHEQPHLPGELGFYDLRLTSVYSDQTRMAKDHGVDGFMFWHYWFGQGRRILEKPFERVLADRSATFPFALGWANESWTRVWYSDSPETLLEQRYPGAEDYKHHFTEVLPALADPRYVTVEGEPIFLVYRPGDLPDPRAFANLWKGLARANGLPGLHLIASNWLGHPEDIGFDSVYLPPQLADPMLALRPRVALTAGLRRTVRRGGPIRVSYSDMRRRYVQLLAGMDNRRAWPVVMPNWDNTPRRNRRGFVLTDTSPAAFKAHVEETLNWLDNRPGTEHLIFVKSWNEWAEGNYLEPDLKFGRGWLRALAAGLRRDAERGWHSDAEGFI